MFLCLWNTCSCHFPIFLIVHVLMVHSYVCWNDLLPVCGFSLSLVFLNQQAFILISSNYPLHLVLFGSYLQKPSLPPLNHGDWDWGYIALQGNGASRLLGWPRSTDGSTVITKPKLQEFESVEHISREGGGLWLPKIHLCHFSSLVSVKVSDWLLDYLKRSFFMWK